MDDNQIKLYCILTCSYEHLRSFELKAYCKATKDLHFDGLPNNYFIHSMTRMQGNRYVMHARNYDKGEYESYCLDIGTMKAETLEMKTGGTITNSFVEGDHMLLVRYNGQISILKDLQDIGQIDFHIKQLNCKNSQLIRSRWSQQSGRSVYAVGIDRCLYRIDWQDIKDGKYEKTVVEWDVENFYVDVRLGLATINTNDTLSLARDTVVDLKAKVDTKAKWTIMTCIAKCWIVCGDLNLKSDGQSIMTGISRQGVVRSTLKIKLTSNGYRKGGIKFAGIYSLHQAYVRGRRGIILAIECDGCCHLISVAYGRMSKLQSIDSIVNEDWVFDKSLRIVTSVTATDNKGRFIAGGFGWIRQISIKLK